MVAVAHAAAEGVDLTGDSLLVIASSSFDPDIAGFLGGVRLGECVLAVRDGGAPVLGFLTSMEREEAASTGLRLLDPDMLEIPKLFQDGVPGPEILRHVVARTLHHAGIQPGVVRLAGSRQNGLVYEALRGLEADNWSFASGAELVRRLRKRKSNAELTGIRQAADGVIDAFELVAAMLRESVADREDLWLSGQPLTVARLKGAVAEVFGRHGLGQPEGGIVAPGEEGAVPHNSGSSERVIRTGETLVVDLFPKGQLYADCTRTFCVGTASEPIAKAHAAVEQVLLWSHHACEAGASGWSLQQGACERLGAAGYATPVSDPATVTGYVHGLGHGVGYELHELPSFRKVDAANEDGLLADGDALTLEPGLYDPEEGYGVRLEDLVILRDGKLENLTPLPYELDPQAWTG